VTQSHDDLSRVPVAVLTAPDTGSSGEFVTIAFRGRPQTRSFGLPTEGRPTGNDTFRLSDGAVIVLTTVQKADRTGHVYPDAPRPPDQTVINGSSRQDPYRSDASIRAAEHWLTAQHACSTRQPGR
jgi:C-terminal processing protease CtpA/Prc